MVQKRHIAFLGATKGMGRALARRLAARGDRLFLLGRDLEEMERSARDLESRAGAVTGSVGQAPCDLADPESFAPALKAAAEALGRLDTVIVTAGVFDTQEAMEKDLDRLRRLLDLDFTHTILFCEHAKRQLLERGGGTLCVFTSVAGDRGRKPVVVYGAAKAGLSRSLEGLDHRHYLDGLTVLDVKPGFVHTAMTAGLKPPPFAGYPEQVAQRVEKALDRGEAMVYTPFPWGLILRVIRLLPRAVLRRVGF